MERCSYFIEDKALFGSFPTQDEVNNLETLGVRCFIDLTNTQEHRTIPYSTKYKYIKYPIVDRHIPADWKSFAQLIVEICRIIYSLKDQEKVYIHCKGGHGRSGILVACILCHHLNISPYEALQKTSKYHAQRPEMRERWRKLGSPQGKKQKDFVYKFFRILKYDHDDQYFTAGMNNFSNHTVTIPNIGTFPNAYSAYLSFKKPSDPEYISQLKKGNITLVDDIVPDENWEDNKVKYMALVLEYKFRQHKIIRDILLNTGLRPLVKESSEKFWGSGDDGSGLNLHGKILMQLRAQLLHEDFLKYKIVEK